VTAHDRKHRSRLRAVAGRARRGWYRLTDPRRLEELRGERMVFRSLEREGLLERFRGGRILEIGPKHGHDSLLLAGLGPQELVLVDLPEKRELVDAWLSRVTAFCPTRYLEMNLLYAPPAEISRLGTFDLVWCLGVVYHNVEQVRLLRRLFNLCKPQGALVLESATVRDRRLVNRNVVEIHWPRQYRDTATITHLPSRLALKSWLEMVGFSEVEIRDFYSRRTGWQRAVLTAARPTEPRPYLSYASGSEPWIAGEAS
jgi:SAM-dependent methyltransferase